jgi:hypothetical protein
MQLGY